MFNKFPKYPILFITFLLLQSSACAKEPQVAETAQTKPIVQKVETSTLSQVDQVNENISVDTIENSTDEKVSAHVKTEAIHLATVGATASTATNSLNAQVAQVTADTNEPSTSSVTVVDKKAEYKKIKSNSDYVAPKAVPELAELTPAAEMLNLAQYKGKVVYLDFWASWCTPCQQTFPWMKKMQEKYPDDLVIVAVNLDESKAKADQFLADKDVNFKIVYDQLWQAGRAYEIFGLPYSFVYNRSGELVGKHGGFAPGDEINLEAALNNLFALGE